MAKRDPNLEYMDIVLPNGNTQETLTVKLYAPDGDIFGMPQGGTALRYVSKGYEIHATPEWTEKNKELMKAKADSLRLSKLQGQISNRKKAIEAQEKLNRDYVELEELDAILASKENELKGLKGDAPGEVVKDTPAPKAKPKATTKAK